MLSHRLRRWLNIKTTFFKCLVFAAKLLVKHYSGMIDKKHMYTWSTGSYADKWLTILPIIR